MNRFLQAAIENIEHVEHDHDRERPRLDMRQQWTQEAIAYALIAIAEMMQGESDAEIKAVKSRLAVLESNFALHTINPPTAMDLLAPNRLDHEKSTDMLTPFVSPLS